MLWFSLIWTRVVIPVPVKFIVIPLYTTAPLNAWIWLAEERSSLQLFSVKRTANVVPGTALHVHITSPNYFCYFNGPCSLKELKLTMTLAKQINTYRIKTTFPCFCHENDIYYTKYILYLSLTDAHIVCTHVNICATVVNATLTI